MWLRSVIKMLQSVKCNSDSNLNRNPNFQSRLIR